MARLRSFTLALIQLGRIGSNKTDNLTHARAMIIKAAEKKPDIIVLPVCHIDINM
jgi:omega-amidase